RHEQALSRSSRFPWQLPGALRMEGSGLDLTLIQSALLALVREFVRRQQLARELLQEVRPDIAAGPGQGVPRPGKKYVSRTQRGVWRQEWNYFIHGSGCRLVNIATLEPIEW